MRPNRRVLFHYGYVSATLFVMLLGRLHGQLTDRTQTPNKANAGIRKSFPEEIGAGRGDVMTPASSFFIIQRDPFRSVRRGRHNLGPKFHERNFDGTVTTHFMTEPLWGVGSTAPYGHDGRSVNLTEVILRHGVEAQAARDAFAALEATEREQI